ncbi:MAG: biotin--[acetyl-CoA-carboxylase] ligase [Candidatus Margulisbacteria bacterium]|nr:biotin--[acetyl-CoA-carboxylase] ligase [Candidatus Margulisiibacteriota bacterium]
MFKLENGICYFDEVGSTNDEAKRLAEAGAKAGTCVVAFAQTKGRGRNGRKWYSAKDEGLYFSIIIKPQEAPKDLTTYVRRAALTTVKAINESMGIEMAIEWPNDLILDERKVGGLLLESVTRGKKVSFLILGLGLNLNQEKFPPDLQNAAISFWQKTGQKYEIKQVAQVIKEAMQSEFS